MLLSIDLSIISQTSWLNTLYLSIDANFKLKQKDRGFSDPPLSNGLAFMVPVAKLNEHLDYCLGLSQTAEVSNNCSTTMLLS